MDTKHFSIVKNSRAAVADLSTIDVEMVCPLVDTELDDIWWYFNRIHVPSVIGNQGLGTQLMNQVCAWADENHFNIVDELNPYGALDLEQLISFNKKFGFELVGDPHIYPVMIRRCKTC